MSKLSWRAAGAALIYIIVLPFYVWGFLAGLVVQAIVLGIRKGMSLLEE